jgi:hypothetical protein
MLSIPIFSEIFIQELLLKYPNLGLVAGMEASPVPLHNMTLPAEPPPMVPLRVHLRSYAAHFRVLVRRRLSFVFIRVDLWRIVFVFWPRRLPRLAEILRSGFT